MEMTEIDHRSPNELCVIVPFGGRIDIWWYVYNHLSQMIVTAPTDDSGMLPYAVALSLFIEFAPSRWLRLIRSFLFLRLCTMTTNASFLDSCLVSKSSNIFPKIIHRAFVFFFAVVVNNTRENAWCLLVVHERNVVSRQPRRKTVIIHRFLLWLWFVWWSHWNHPERFLSGVFE